MTNNINISNAEAETDRGGGGGGGGGEDVKQKRPSISLNDSGVQLVSLFTSSINSIGKSDSSPLESQSAVPASNSSNSGNRGGGGMGGGGTIAHQDSSSNNSSSNSVLNIDNPDVPSSSSFAYMSPSRKWMVSDAITVGHQSQYTQQSKSPPRSKEVRCRAMFTTSYY